MVFVCSYSHPGRCDKGTGECYLCTSMEHRWRECPMLRLACPCCGLIGHKVENCPTRKELQMKARSQVASSMPRGRPGWQKPPTGQRTVRTQASGYGGRTQPVAQLHALNHHDATTAGNAVTGTLLCLCTYIL